MLQLVASTEETNSTSIPIRWCVGRDTLAKLQEKEALNPHLLLVVAQGRYEVSRSLVPIDQIMEYVDFKKPGNYRIFAAVVWNSRGDTRVLEKRIFGGKVTGGGKSREFSEARVFDGEDIYLRSHDEPSSKFALCSLDETASIEVNVAEEFFASPPSKFEKFWVNFWFERMAGNQCQFRRRRMLAYTIQPFVVLPYLLCKTIVRSIIGLFLLLCGMRGVNLHPIIHPWAMDNNDIWWHVGRSVFTATKDGKARQLIVAMFAPSIHVCIVVGAYVVTYFQSSQKFWQVAGISEFCVAVIFGILYLVAAVSLVYDTISNAVRGIAPKVIAVVVLLGLASIAIRLGLRYPLITIVIASLVGIIWLASRLMTTEVRKLESLPEDERKHVLLERENARYQSIACNGPMVASLSALPEERRTIYLRYRDLKAKLCKQFAA